ncbi:MULTISPECIES: helix-turn-helix domain-containing protein [unclassified Thioalkalivibrio]|uniref:winged helix-turn-helix transcriptional regulator n=1 Tax=unclassified Thioalkalivibrio TaxID=2621013 RepID=UPI000370E0D7|nr:MULTISPECIES: helix-turn-helix domain-containing protein [unclassified Thioalkalivibrio]
MTAQVRYGQFCPVAKTSEILTRRWTPLIMRELISGSTGFNEIHRGVPLMSRALLSKRLKELEDAGVISHEEKPPAYKLTEAGGELAPVIVAMGVWGQRWVESASDGPDWDAGVLMWDMRRRIDTGMLPPGRIVLQFDFADAPAELRRWWLLIEDDDVDLCQSDPGFEVDLFVRSTVRAMGRVWIGQRGLRAALNAEDIVLYGDRRLARSIPDWLQLSVIAEEAARQRPTSGRDKPGRARKGHP